VRRKADKKECERQVGVRKSHRTAPGLQAAQRNLDRGRCAPELEAQLEEQPVEPEPVFARQTAEQ